MPIYTPIRDKCKTTSKLFLSANNDKAEQCKTNKYTIIYYNDTVRLLGVHLDTHLCFTENVNKIAKESQRRISQLQSLSSS